MKSNAGFLAKAIALSTAALALAGPCFATITVVDPGTSISTYYTHSTSDSIVSFDRDASANLYYVTTPSTFDNTNLWKSSGGTPTNLYSSSPNYPGASVAKVGNYVYFGDNSFTNSFIRGYGPLTGSPTTSLFSTSAPPRSYYGFSGHAGALFLTGTTNPSTGINEIFYSSLAGDGDLSNEPPVSLGVTSGNSGPLAFDISGNLYYAPGFGDLSIYKWSSAELAAAIANPVTNALAVASHKWADYSSRGANVDGASAMDFDANGNLVVNLTRFSATSFLVKFGVNGSGVYDGSNATLLTDTGRLGEVRNVDGTLLVSSDNKIVAVVPEPSSALLVLLGSGAFLARRRRS